MTATKFDEFSNLGIEGHVAKIKDHLARMESRREAAADRLEDLRTGIAKQVQTSRQFNQLSRGELAHVMKEHGFDTFYRQTIERIEQGDRQVRFDEAVVFADIFGWSLDWFRKFTESGSVQR